jgi:uncharacterized delta-60 repeat protein
MRKLFAVGVALVVVLTAAGGSAATSAPHPGSLDRTFGTGGRVTNDRVGPSMGAEALALQSHGSIVAAGYGGTDSDTAFLLARYKPSGSLDTRFGSNGMVQTHIGPGLSWVTALAVQADDKLDVAGTTFSNGFFGFALARYTAGGQLDPSFGAGGIVTPSFGNSAEGAGAVAVDAQGRIIVAGTSGNGYRNDFALARYLPNGQPDPSFGDQGKVLTPVGVGGEILAIALQPDGKLNSGRRQLGRLRPPTPRIRACPLPH